MTDPNTYYYPITGRKNTGGVFDRIPIEDMQKNHPRQFTLFVLAFAAIQGVNISFTGVDLLAETYMQIAGIHGKPYTEYAGDRKAPAEKDSDFDDKDPKDTLPVPSRFGGYCNHGSVSFPTWHRPYTMLIEQAVGNAADRIAVSIEQNNPGEAGKWVPEAQKLRFPYWDWAEPRVEKEGLPPVLYEEKLQITVAGGQTTTINNPLAFYSYQAPIPPDFTNETDKQTNETAYFAKWTRTYRYAASEENPPGNNIDALQKAMKEQAASVRHKIGLLFAYPDGQDPVTTYDKFSNSINESRREQDYENLGSLESIHGELHGILGGNGHMSDPDYAAFDPVFFFHHSNVDRLYALWEWCYRDYWMGDGYTHEGQNYPWTQQRGTYMQVYNEQILPSGARGRLFPFRLENGDYWMSEQARFFDANAYPKYYSYQEFLGVKVDKQASNQERVEARKRIATYYGFDPQEAAKKVDRSAWGHLPVLSAIDAGLKSGLKVISGFRVFVILVRLPEHAFNRTYSFELYYNKSVHVGSVTVFARSDHSPCKACAKRREAGSVIRGIIPLRPSLLNEILVQSARDRLRKPVSGVLGLATSAAATATQVLSFDTSILDITKTLSGKLVDMGRKDLASADGAATTPVSDKKAASPKVIPVETSLYTCGVAENTGGTGLPVHLFDWQSHLDLFPNGWKALSMEAQ